MSAEKSLALVLRVIEFSETSYVVTLWTEHFGKISALAKGARRPKSPFESALDLLAICRVVFLHKQSDGLDLLTEAKLERRFRAAARDLNQLYAAFYVVELLDSLTDKHDQTPGVFWPTIHAIRSLDEGASPRRCLTWWEIHLLRALGSWPELQNCVDCGRTLAAETRTVVFGLLAGGLLCADCKAGQRQLIRISRTTIDTLQRLAEQPNLAEITLAEEEITSEVRALINQYLWHLLGHRPRTFTCVGSLIV